MLAWVGVSFALRLRIPIPIPEAMAMDLQAKTLKATVVLDPEAVGRIVVPTGQPKVTLRITVAGRRLTAEVNAKSLRRAVASVHATGADAVVIVLQGKLEPNDVLAEAGITAQPKAPKAAAA